MKYLSIMLLAGLLMQSVNAQDMGIKPKDKKSNGENFVREALNAASNQSALHSYATYVNNSYKDKDAIAVNIPLREFSTLPTLNSPFLANDFNKWKVTVFSAKSKM